MQRRIHWIGDSTVQRNRAGTWPQSGMGQMLELYLRPGITVCSYAKNGRSTKSFWDEGRFEPVLEAMAPGDILLIQFGHNDEKTQDPTRYTTPEEYQKNLLRYANLARQAGALPILVTPLTRRRFEGDVLTGSHGPYPDAVRSLARREGIPLIDLTSASRKAVGEMGERASRRYYMVFGPGEYPNYPEGKEDNTHLRCEGAFLFAGMIADGLRALGEPYCSLVEDQAE